MFMHRFILFLAVAANSVGGSLGYAQTSPSSTTALKSAASDSTTQISAKTMASNAGVISELAPDRIVIRTETGTMSYASSAKTIYVDETGSPIAAKLVGQGDPVTVQFARMGERLLADRIVVRRLVTHAAPAPVDAPAPIQAASAPTPAPAPIHAASAPTPAPIHAASAPAPAPAPAPARAPVHAAAAAAIARLTTIAEPAAVLVRPAVAEKTPPVVAVKKVEVDRPVPSKKKTNAARQMVATTPAIVKRAIPVPIIEKRNHTQTTTVATKWWKRADEAEDEEEDEDD